MLMRTDPFRELDRLAQQVLGAGTTSRPAVMPMDAWREGDAFVHRVRPARRRAPRRSTSTSSATC